MKHPRRESDQHLLAVALGERVDAPADRGAGERDEWEAAGAVATGLERAVVALALARARDRHGAAEGVETS